MNKVILINKEHPIKPTYQQKVKLVSVKNVEQEEVLVEETAYAAYQELKSHLKKKSISIGIDSTYRSLEEQEQIKEDFIIKYGIEKANQLVAPTGTSEHHTGLAIDIALEKNGVWLNNPEDFTSDTNETMEAIHQELAQFGFILRYPKGKETVTGYNYEPWHIRYVGKVVANQIMKKYKTLEEYLEKFSGVLLVNKKAGMTSFDVVNELSHLFGIKRIGHTGTLDPLAEGVLVVTIGSASKIAELLTATEKEYQAGVLLGVKTDTLDITGTVLETKPVADHLDIESILQTFNKTYEQEVPLYSAVKVAGKKLYEYARTNQPVTLPKKEVTIQNMKLLTTDRNTFVFKCLVSKGCYIRSLIHDIGLSLNTYATMTKLTRIKQGKFELSKTSTLTEIEQGNFHLYSVEEVLDYKTITVKEDLEQKIRTGQKIENTFSITDKVIFKDETGTLLGIYEACQDQLKTWKNFV